MPSALTYIEPNNNTREQLGGRSEREERTRDYQKNKKYYDGDQPEWLIQEYDDPVNDNVTINVTKQAIDRTISFLFPEMPLLQLDLNDDTPDEMWLNDAWMANGGAYFLDAVCQNGALSGHNYVKIIQRDGFPRLVAINPTVPITYWKADDPDTVLWHELRFTLGKQESMQDIIRNADGTWTIREFTKKVSSKKWIEIVENKQEWSGDFAPMVAWPHLPNPNNYYGLAEVTKITRDLNDDINRVASDIGKILRYHASPRTIATGASLADIIPTSINGLFTIENAAAKVYNLEMQSDLASSMAYLNYLYDSFLTLNRVVVMKGTVKDFQRVTNTGIQAVFIDMLAKNGLLRWSYGMGIQRISQSILFAANRTNKIVPTVTWADPLPSDPLETVNRLTIEQANGWNNPISINKYLGYEWGVNVENWTEAAKYEWIPKNSPPPQAKTQNSNSSQNDQNLN